MSVASASPHGKVLETGQKRWAAVLFADLEDFTGISERGSPENTYELIMDFARATRDIVERHQGHMVEYAGDSALAVFGAPIAVENASLNACRAALEIQTHMRASAERNLARYGVAPRIRIGIAGGVIVIGDLEDWARAGPGVLGNAVNLASRIQHLAPPGEIVCAGAVHQQVEGMVETTSLGTTPVKGLSKDVELLRLDGLKQGLTSFQARLNRSTIAFVGRDEELDWLNAWLALPPAEAGPVDLSGPAGIGKSRLVFEARNLASDRRVLVANCNTHIQNKPFAPLVELILLAAGWSPGDPPDRLAGALRGLLGPDTPGVDDLADFLRLQDAAMTGADYDSAVNIRALLSQALFALCTDPALAVVFEDIHWIDQSSSDILTGLVRSAGTGVKVLTTRRSDYAVDWAKLPQVTHCLIGPLPAEGIARMAADLLQVQAVPEDLLQVVARNSEGNALFAEETIRYLLHTGQVTVRDGSVVLDLRTDGQTTSGDLQHLILSRYDMLGADARAQLLTGAVKGRRFSEDLLVRCFGEAETVRAAMDEALSAGLIEPGPSGRTGDWQFAHALFGAAIRQSVPQSRAQAIHASIAAALDTGDATGAADHAEELSYHYDKAGDAANAVRFLRKSAEKALSIYSVAQANSHLERAFALVEVEPGIVDEAQFASLLVLWAQTLEIYGDFRKLDAVIEANLPRLKAAGAPAGLASCVTLQAVGRCLAGEHGRAADLAREALTLAEQSGDAQCIVSARFANLLINMRSETWPHEKVLAVYRDLEPGIAEVGDPYLFILAQYYLSGQYRAVGQLRQSAEVAAKLVDYGRRTSNARARSFGSNALALTLFRMDDIEGVSAAVGESLRYAIPDTGAWRVAHMLRYAVDTLTGKPGTEIEDILVHADRAADFQDGVLEVACRGQYSINLFRRGRIDEGWRQLARVDELAKTVGTPENFRILLFIRINLLMAFRGLSPDPKPAVRPKLGWRDVLRVLRLRPGTVRHADRLLSDLLAMLPDPVGSVHGQVYQMQAMLAQSRGRRQEAEELLKKAHAIFVEQDMAAKAQQVESQLAQPGS